MQIRKANVSNYFAKARSHDPELYDRLFARIKVNLNEINKCWEWDKPFKNKSSYPTIRKFGVKIRANRMVYRMFKGIIPDGMCVLHRCDNPLCCNPQHLHVGTHYENMQERKERNRGGNRSGEKNGRSKLTEDQAKTILKSKKKNTELAREYGVTKTAIGLIKKSKNWKHLREQKDVIC